jgi:hypothetical protein
LLLGSHHKTFDFLLFFFGVLVVKKSNLKINRASAAFGKGELSLPTCNFALIKIPGIWPKGYVNMIRHVLPHPKSEAFDETTIKRLLVENEVDAFELYHLLEFIRVYVSGGDFNDAEYGTLLIHFVRVKAETDLYELGECSYQFKFPFDLSAGLAMMHWLSARKWGSVQK